MKTNLHRFIALILCFAILTPLTAFSSFEDDKDPLAILYEDENKRSESVKHFVCSDGSMMAVYYPAAIHEFAPDGSWHDIDNRLVYNSASMSYENQYNQRFSVAFSDESTDQMVGIKADYAPMIQLYTAIVNQDESILPVPDKNNIVADYGKENNFSNVLLNDTAYNLTAYNTSVEYKKVYDKQNDISIKYTLDGCSLKEDIILNKAFPISAFVTHYTISDMLLAQSDDGTLEFRGNSGESLYSVSAPYMYDSAGAVSMDFQVIVEEAESGYTVKYIPDAEWLNDIDRVYPITFDPLIYSTYCTFSGFIDTYIDYSLTDTEATHASEPFLCLNKQTSPTYDVSYRYAVVRINHDFGIDLQHCKITDIALRFKTYTGNNNVTASMYEVSSDTVLSTGYYPSGPSICTATGSTYYTFHCADDPDNGRINNILNHMALGNEGKYLFYCDIGNATDITLNFYSSNHATSSNRPYISISYAIRLPEGKYFNILSVTTDYTNQHGYLTGGDNNSVSLISTEESYATQAWEFEILDNAYYSYAIKNIGTGEYLVYDNGVKTEEHVGTSFAYKYWWTVTVNNLGEYSLCNQGNGGSFLRSYYSCDVFCITASSNSPNTLEDGWIIQDCFTLKASLEDNVEYALRSCAFDQYVEYNNTAYPSMPYMTSFNPTIDVTTLDPTQSLGYTATTRATCQRFTIVPSDAYYHILPFMKTGNSLKGHYSDSEGWLRVSASGVEISCNSSTSRKNWIIDYTNGGFYTIISALTGTYLACDMYSGILVLSNTPYYWDIKPICLNAEKDYQRYTNTCGAATAVMLCNYVTNGNPITENDYISGIESYYSSGAYRIVSHNKSYINHLLSYNNSNVNCYVYSRLADVPSNTEIMGIMCDSLNSFHPSICNIRLQTNTYTPVWGYQTDGHYIMVKGIFFDSRILDNGVYTGEYKVVINDPYYKFGAPPQNKPYKPTNNIGGRDIIVTIDELAGSISASSYIIHFNGN